MVNIHRSKGEFYSNYYEKFFCIRSNKELENQSRQCDFSLLIKNKSYIAMNGCVLDSIITNREFSNNEKLYYILADSLALINANSGKERSIALSSDGWADRLDCTRSQIFSMQKSLEEKGFFIIHKDRNNIGQNKRNIIIPTLPQEIFNNLCQSSQNIGDERVGGFTIYDPNIEYMRSYLDRTKLFIKINYDLLSGIIAHDCLSSFQKIIWLDFYIKSYKRHIFSRNENYNIDIIYSSFHNFNNNVDFSFINSQIELANRYSCTKKHISKSINILKDLNFINYEQFYIKHQDRNNDNDRQDKSLYKISISLPLDFWFGLENVKNRSKVGSRSTNVNNIDISEEGNEINRVGSLYFNDDDDFDENKNEAHLFKEPIIRGLNDSGVFYDPPFSKIRPLLNKDLKLNIKILDQDLIKKSKILKNKNEARNSKNLMGYLPFTNSDLEFLKEESGYSIDFINELSKKLALEYSDRNFYSKEIVMKYLLIALKHERREIKKEGKFKLSVEAEGGSKLKLKTKFLDEFIPFNENILKEISRKIDFKYSNHFIIKLAKHMNHKYPDLKFKSEKSLINYMVKSLDNEMRKPEEVNRDNFIFRWELEEIEKYEILAKKDKMERNGIMERFHFESRSRYKFQEEMEEEIEGFVFESGTKHLSNINKYKHIYGSNNRITPNFYNISESDKDYLANEPQEGAMPIGNIMKRFLE